LIARRISKLLLCIWLLSSVFPSLLYFALQHNLHLEFESKKLAGISSRNVSVFEMQQKDFQRSQISENEIKINGVIYDVISTSFKGNLAVIRCAPDAKETKLTDNFNAAANQNSKTAFLKLKKLFESLFWSNTKLIVSPILTKEDSHFQGIYNTCYILQKVQNPPPEIA
jgi:hypothetical protein